MRKEKDTHTQVRPAAGRRNFCDKSNLVRQLM